MPLVLFVDMDYYYAACEELRHPDAKGKPMIVGTGDEANKLKGVVESCNYEARKFGIRSAMPVAMALKIKSDIIYIPADHDYYDRTSKQIMEILKGLGFRMEVISVDEAAVDLGEMGYKEGLALGKRVKEEINKKLDLPCTVGLADGKVFAKIVCDSAKPNGLKLVEKKDMAAFLADKGTQRIPGIGAKTAEKLEGIGVKTIGELAKADIRRLSTAVGSFGMELHQIANGIDESQVVEQYEILSIGRERTLGATKDLSKIDALLDELSDEVGNEVVKNGFRFKTITAKARYNDFTDKIKSKTIGYATDSLDTLKETSKALIRELVKEKPVRKVGVRVSSFESGKQQRRLF
jgi:nucleotidyltransferase/DNA polymerase involved in DNA repair